MAALFGMVIKMQPSCEIHAPFFEPDCLECADALNSDRIEFKREPSFSNAIIKAPVATKPHICKRAGWWRVSPAIKPYHEWLLRWRQAHYFIGNLNVNEHPGRLLGGNSVTRIIQKVTA